MNANMNKNSMQKPYSLSCLEICQMDIVGRNMGQSNYTAKIENSDTITYIYRMTYPLCPQLDAKCMQTCTFKIISAKFVHYSIYP